jgi:pilus assembly protein Flp/PilA
MIMTRITKTIRAFVRDENGAAAIEYGLLAALIAVMIVAGARAIGVSLDTIFTSIADTLVPPKTE